MASLGEEESGDAQGKLEETRTQLKHCRTERKEEKTKDIKAALHFLDELRHMNWRSDPFTNYSETQLTEEALGNMRAELTGSGESLAAKKETFPASFKTSLDQLAEATI